MGGYRIRPEIQAMVKYEQVNLIRDDFPVSNHPTGAFDLIICRNVFIYLDQVKIALLLDRFRDCLREDGWLIVSAAEMQPTNLNPFECVRMGGAIFYRKKGSFNMKAPSGVGAPKFLKDNLENPSSGNYDQSFLPESLNVQASRGGTSTGAGDHGAEETLDSRYHHALAEIQLEQGDFPARARIVRGVRSSWTMPIPWPMYCMAIYTGWKVNVKGRAEVIKPHCSCSVRCARSRSG